MRIIYNTSFIIDEDIETAWIGFIPVSYTHLTLPTIYSV